MDNNKRLVKRFPRRAFQSSEECKSYWPHPIVCFRLPWAFILGNSVGFKRVENRRMKLHQYDSVPLGIYVSRTKQSQAELKTFYSTDDVKKAFAKSKFADEGYDCDELIKHSQTFQGKLIGYFKATMDNPYGNGPFPFWDYPKPEPFHWFITEVHHFDTPIGKSGDITGNLTWTWIMRGPILKQYWYQLPV